MKKYEIHQPTYMIDIYIVRADSKEEALQKYKANEDCEQNCSIAGSTNSGFVEVYGPYADEAGELPAIQPDDELDRMRGK